MLTVAQHGLLPRVWPREKVVAGLQVSKDIRSSLLEEGVEAVVELCPCTSADLASVDDVSPDKASVMSSFLGKLQSVGCSIHLRCSSRHGFFERSFLKRSLVCLLQIVSGKFGFAAVQTLCLDFSIYRERGKVAVKLKPKRGQALWKCFPKLKQLTMKHVDDDTKESNRHWFPGEHILPDLIVTHGLEHLSELMSLSLDHITGDGELVPQLNMLTTLETLEMRYIQFGEDIDTLEGRALCDSGFDPNLLRIDPNAPLGIQFCKLPNLGELRVTLVSAKARQIFPLLREAQQKEALPPLQELEISLEGNQPPVALPSFADDVINACTQLRHLALWVTTQP